MRRKLTKAERKFITVTYLDGLARCPLGPTPKYGPGPRQKDLATLFRVAQSTISNAVKEESYCMMVECGITDRDTLGVIRQKAVNRGYDATLMETIFTRLGEPIFRYNTKGEG